MPPDWDLGQIAIFQLATHLEGLIKIAAINGPCGGDASELARSVKDKTVRVIKSNGLDFYFFPSVNIGRGSMNRETIRRTRKPSRTMRKMKLLKAWTKSRTV